MIDFRTENGGNTLVLMPVPGEKMNMEDKQAIWTKIQNLTRTGSRIEAIKADPGIVFEGDSMNSFFEFLSGVVNDVKMVDFSNIEAPDVRSANYMFSLPNVEEIYIPKLPSLSNANNMIFGCSELKFVDMSGLSKTPEQVMEIFSGCNKLEDVKTNKNIDIPLNWMADAIDTADLYYIRKFDNSKLARMLYKAGVPLNCLKEVMERNIFTEENASEWFDNGKGLSPEHLLARTWDEYKYIEDGDHIGDFLKTGFSYEHVLNFINADERGDNLTDDEIKDLIEKKPDIEELLNKLKTGELTACWSDFHEHSLKKAGVLFVDDKGYVRANVEMKKLDERFPRFIKGILKETGQRMSFVEFVADINEKDINIHNSPLTIPYLYALSSLQGFTPDNKFLNGMSEHFYNKETGNYDFPADVKRAWKLYNTSKAWCRNKETTDAFMRISKVFGLFEEDANKRQTGENYLRAMTNYIPETVKLDGYSLAEMYPDEELPSIGYASEITIKPGIPYKAKKCHKALVKILEADEELTALVGDVDKFLKKVEPIAELMDNYSIDDMPNGAAKHIMQLLVKDLYISTEGKEVPVDKAEFRGAEGKEALQKFRKLTESYAGEEDINMHVLDSRKTHALFGGLTPEYNPDFAKFINNHLRDILYSDNPWSMGGKLATIQKSWDYIQNKRDMNRRQFHDKPAWKISFKEIDDILGGIIYDREGRLADEKYDELAELCFSYRYDQGMFERCCDLYDEMCARDHTSIPDVSGECGNYHYKFLSLDDPAAIFFGQILDCCQQFGNAGESCMLHSCRSKDGRVFGVFDENGMMVAGSWTWRNGDTVCFDNVEAANNPDIENILEAYADAADRIREATAEGDIINKVTVGQGYSDIPLGRLLHDTVNKYPLQEVSYISDSRTQYILSYSGRSNDIETRALYEQVQTEHVNASLGASFESSAGTRRNVYNEPDWDYGLDDDEEEDYEERHSEKVISDDIDDCEIIDRVKSFCEKKELDNVSHRDEADDDLEEGEEEEYE